MLDFFKNPVYNMTKFNKRSGARGQQISAGSSRIFEISCFF